MVYLLKMVIFHSYVKLPEGMCCFFNIVCIVQFSRFAGLPTLHLLAESLISSLRI